MSQLLLDPLQESFWWHGFEQPSKRPRQAQEGDVEWLESKLALLKEHLKQRGIEADLTGWSVKTEASKKA